MDSLEIAGICHNAFEAMSVLQHKQVDVMFLDINMPRLLGTEFFRSLRNPPKVIFTTAHRDYALEGYELDAVDFLLKPISLERFFKAVSKLTRNEDLQKHSEKEVFVPNTNSFLYFRSERKMNKVMLNEIIYAESLKDYVRIFRNTGKPLLVKQSMSSLEEMLPDNQFIRIHRCYIIAIDKVTAFTNQDVEIGGIEIPIGRLYSHHIGRLSNA
jgi:DNA-binding LytR/AlgR family response regulator